MICQPLRSGSFFGKFIVRNYINAFMLLALTGCDMFDTPVDNAAKISLRGNWYVEHQIPSGLRIKQVFELSESGTFTKSEKIDNLPLLANGSGNWYITEGLLKLHTNQMNGQKLGSLDSQYSTCKIEGAISSEFFCQYAGDKEPRKYVRVQKGFLLN
jgi:hypothetical protein